jgi:hypothetical protein
MTPFLHAVFLRNPTDLIETGDYSYFAKFNADVSSCHRSWRRLWKESQPPRT